MDSVLRDEQDCTQLGEVQKCLSILLKEKHRSQMPINPMITQANERAAWKKN